jgi:hypothetical protein
MRNDATTTILNFVLATTIIAGVVCGYLSIKRTRDQRNLAPVAMQLNSKMMMVQSLVTDVNSYNQQAKSPEIAKMLQTLLSKPVAKTP